MMRRENNPPERIVIGGLRLDPQQRMLWCGREKIRLPKLSYNLLLSLIRHAPGIVTSEQLLDEVWGDVVVGDETVKQRISVLRQALGDRSEQPTYIESIRGVGYRLIPEVKIEATGRSYSSRFKFGFMAPIVLLIILGGWFVSRDVDVPGQSAVIITEGILRDNVITSSIAVLAFENISPDPDDAYFAEGISEEVLHVLARIDGLRVASRTSAFSFRGSNQQIREIARQLGVAHVLEGSVRMQGTRVRITAQLIDAETDVNLWSDSYDREISDIFVVQEEIAQSIALAMQDVLGVRTVKVEKPTQDIEAYQLFLRGRQLFYRRGAALDSSIGALRAAVARDPNFAEAWTFLAAAAMIEWGYDTAISEQDARAIAEEASAKALELDPNMGLALAVQAQLAVDRRDFDVAFDLYRRAIIADPDDSTSRMWFGQVNFHYGYLSEAQHHLIRAYERDPLVGIINGALGMTYLASGQEELAQEYFAKAEKVGWEHHVETKVNHLILSGASETAIAFFQPFYTASNNPEWLHSWSLFVESLRDPASVDALVAHSETLRGPKNFTKLTLYLMLDLKDRFFDLFSEIVPSDPHWRFRMRPVWLPGNRHYVEDPRFLEIMGQAGIVALWEERGYPDGCVRDSGLTGDYLDCARRYQGHIPPSD